MDEVEIISLHKRCNKTGAKAGVKTGAKAPRSGDLLFLRKQIGKMTGEDRKNYHSIVSGRWKKVKEDTERLIAYDNRAKQMRIEGEKVKPTKSGDDQHDPLVSFMTQHEEMVPLRIP